MRSWGWSPHDEINALIRRGQDTRELTLRCKDTARRQPSTSQEESPHQEPNHVGTLVVDLQLLELWEISVVYAAQSTVSCPSSLNWLKYWYWWQTSLPSDGLTSRRVSVFVVWSHSTVLETMAVATRLGCGFLAAWPLGRCQTIEQDFSEGKICPVFLWYGEAAGLRWWSLPNLLFPVQAPHCHRIMISIKFSSAAIIFIKFSSGNPLLSFLC